MRNKNFIQKVETSHPKQEFQVERIAFFSDAIFAIAITLLIIEFKVPHVEKDTSFEKAFHDISNLKYNLFSLLLSFFLISSYWIKHHFLFKHIIDYNRTVVAANLFTLLPIIFFPFTTAYMAESIESEHVVVLALQIFLANHLLANISIYLFYWLTFVKHKELTYPMETKERKRFISKTLLSIFILSLGLIMTFLFTNMEVIFWTLSLSMIFQSVFKRMYSRVASNKAVKKINDHKKMTEASS